MVEGEDKYQMKPDLAILPMIVRNGMRRKMKNKRKMVRKRGNQTTMRMKIYIG